MEKEEKLKDLQRRIKHIINNYCNAIGCKDCPLKWDESCSAIELQNEEMELEHNH
jgi:hypothetical protein